MKIEEMNAGKKIAYDVDGTRLDFAGGALTMDLDRYRRDYPVTKDVMADGDGNLTLGSGGRYYVAQVEIPANTYTEVQTEAEEEPVGTLAASEEQPTAPDNATMQLDPLDMEKVVLRLWSVAGIEIF
ncbi:hypothetical protein [uncultured Subdoligranulum sp.]|uniref:hypothetical protein n=1 Tax=uncultured Subdoligranulum sp. TaxID=512298 RepID=UPI0025DD95BB|nr:hypothetical protein [uncultured Subdoligranulum sp.]